MHHLLGPQGFCAIGLVFKIQRARHSQEKIPGRRREAGRTPPSQCGALRGVPAEKGRARRRLDRGERHSPWNEPSELGQLFDFIGLSIYFVSKSRQAVRHGERSISTILLVVREYNTRLGFDVAEQSFG